MKKSITVVALILAFALHTAAQTNDDACAAMKTIMNALTTKQYDKVVDWSQKKGLLHYGSKVTIPGFKNCRFLATGGVVLFEAEYDGSNISNNRKMLDDLGWIIAPCFSGFASSGGGNKRVWFKDGNPSAGRITIYDRGNGQYIELEISGNSGR